MGLDSYIKVVPNSLAEEKFNIKQFSGELPESFHLTYELCYWRKNYEIHDFFSNLYEEKTSLEFNCIPFRIDQEELDLLKEKFNDCPQIKKLCKYYHNFLKHGFSVYFYSWY